jgi:hypothetical protein
VLGSLVSVHIIWVSCQSLYDAGMILRSHMARRVCFFLVSLYELTYDPAVERGDLWFLVSSLDLLRDAVFLI